MLSRHTQIKKIKFLIDLIFHLVVKKILIKCLPKENKKNLLIFEVTDYWGTRLYNKLKVYTVLGLSFCFFKKNISFIF